MSMCNAARRMELRAQSVNDDEFLEEVREYQYFLKGIVPTRMERVIADTDLLYQHSIFFFSGLSYNMGSLK